MNNMTPTLPRWLDPNPISSKKLQNRPSMQFEHGLVDWEQQRGHELTMPHPPSYAYYARQFRCNADLLENDFRVSESVRQDIRDGAADPDDFAVEVWNTEPQFILERLAYQFGWRLVPYARWVASQSRAPSFAHDVESAARGWTAQADAIWLTLMRMSRESRDRESHLAMVLPVRTAARKIEARVLEYGSVLCKS